MSFTPRIFINDELFLEKEIKITDKTFHYIANVMKCEIDDEIILINGKDGEFLSKIILINNKYLNLKIILLILMLFSSNYSPIPSIFNIFFSFLSD